MPLCVLSAWWRAIAQRQCFVALRISLEGCSGGDLTEAQSSWQWDRGHPDLDFGALLQQQEGTVMNVKARIGTGPGLTTRAMQIKDRLL